MFSVISGATPADASLAVSTSNLERMRITPSGCVGIGKSNATYTLDVVGDINFTGTLRSNNTPLSLNLPADITVDNVDAKTSATLSVGANAATTILNLGTNGANQAINMGTGSGLKTITIGGGTDDTIAINGNLTVAGTTISVNSSNATIVDKIITLNKNGAAASGALVGLEIEEAGSAAGGYLRTNATRDAWVAKAPNGSEVTIGGAYTASAPLSISGTTLSIANATTSAPGVVQVSAGNGLSISSNGLLAMAAAATSSGYGMFVCNGVGSSGYAVFTASSAVNGMTVASPHGVRINTTGVYLIIASLYDFTGTGSGNYGGYAAIHINGTAYDSYTDASRMGMAASHQSQQQGGWNSQSTVTTFTIASVTATNIVGLSLHITATGWNAAMCIVRIA
jgi:hypothetical protein